MKPPRSVWVSGEAVRCMATKGWTRYDLHRPRAKRKARKGVQPCGCDINTDGAHQHGCRSGSRRPSKARKGGEVAR